MFYRIPQITITKISCDATASFYLIDVSPMCLSFSPKNRTITLFFELNERVSFSSWDFFLTVKLDGLIKSILVEMFLAIKSCIGVNEVVL